MNKVASILVHRNVPTHYSYSLENGAEFSVGEHVEVPIGRSNAKGVIVRIDDENEIEKPSYTLKAVLSTVQKKPILSQEILNLIQWFSDTYLISPFQAYQCIIGNIKLRKDWNKSAEFGPEEIPHHPNKEQLDIISAICDTSGEEHLIQGVTGSGKTEIYLQVAAKHVSENKGVIMLLPEIALTPQMRQHFKKRFGSQVAVLHSNLSVKEREIEWNRIYHGAAKIIVGPRSAIFAPVENLGLIILDEEHEGSYKQDNQPRYLAHSVARFRVQETGSTLIFGSATPSLDTVIAIKETGNHYHLHHRVNQKPLPKITLIDKCDSLINDKSSVFSQVLLDKLETILSKKEKAIILMNRRGFASLIVCQKCQKVHTCPGCDLSYTYHKSRKFQCHRCHTTAPITHTCSHCGKNTLAFVGQGTQKVEVELQDLFPNAKIIRIDRDNTKKESDLTESLNEFETNADIMIGTQMIAKGLHFEDVTLVGVLGIDTTLALPDFRAPERAFQLITQVAGRAGRGRKEGEVVVETRQMEHYAIACAQHHDTMRFLNQEAQFRSELWYPPFCELTSIIMSCTNKGQLATYAAQIKQHLNNVLPEVPREVEILGPQAAPFEKIKNHYRFICLIKHSKARTNDVRLALQALPPHPTSLRCFIDIDPRSVL
ncbi:MAG: primosomal protein N' [bacterium]|nr:primosomal protein N' [bacterium]